LYPSEWVKLLSLYAFRNSGIVVYCGLVFETPKSLNPKTQNTEVVVPHPFTFQNSGVVMYCGLVFETLKSQNPEVVVPHPFIFHNLGVDVYCGFLFETPKSQNLKSRSGGATSFHLSEFRSCCVLWFGI
jgi:hypothetical protein